MELTRIKNDVNGSPRYVVHYMELLSEDDFKAPRNTTIPEALEYKKIMNSTDYAYKLALKKAKKIGGRKFHNKQFGGGIVFQSYNTADLIKHIEEIKNA